MKFFQDFLQTWSWGEILLTLVFATVVFVIIFCCTCRKYATLGSRFVSRPVDPDRKQPPAGDDNQKPCGTEPAEAGKIGLAVVIANEYEGENKLKGTAKDKQRWEEALRNLQFDVRTSKKVGLNANKTEMLRLIESLSQIHIRDADVPHCRNIAFVFSGHGYSGGIFSQDLEQLNLESDVFPLLFREKFDSRRKFIFVDACRTTESGQKGFEITASMIPKGSSKPNVIGVGAFVAYATLDRLAATDLKDGSHFSKFTTEEIQNNNTISAALDKAIGKVDKQPVKYYTRPTYINQLSGELNLYKEAGCIFQLKRFIKGWIPWFKRDTGTQAAPVNPTPQPPPSQPHPPVPQPGETVAPHSELESDDSFTTAPSTPGENVLESELNVSFATSSSQSGNPPLLESQQNGSIDSVTDGIQPDSVPSGVPDGDPDGVPDGEPDGVPDGVGLEPPITTLEPESSTSTLHPPLNGQDQLLVFQPDGGPDTMDATSSVPHPPSTSAGDTSSSQHPQSLEFYSLTPSDVGLSRILSDQPDWEFLAIGLGVPIHNVQTYSTGYESKLLGGLLALQYWRDGRSGQSYPPTWKFLLQNVEDTFGENVAADFEKKASKQPTWSISTSTSSVPQPLNTSAGDTSSSQHPQSLEFYSLTPSDVGLSRILSDQPNWEVLAIGLGVPIHNVHTYSTGYESKLLGGLLALKYWRDGHSGQSFPPTWKFLLQNVEDTFGENVAADFEEKASKQPTWSISTCEDVLKSESNVSFATSSSQSGNPQMLESQQNNESIDSVTDGIQPDNVPNGVPNGVPDGVGHETPVAKLEPESSTLILHPPPSGQDQSLVFQPDGGPDTTVGSHLVHQDERDGPLVKSEDDNMSAHSSEHSRLCATDKPTEKELCTHVTTQKLIIPVWEKVCEGAGVSRREIDAVKRDHSTAPVSEVFFQCLRLWREGRTEHTKPVTWETLLTALVQAGLNDEAKHIEHNVLKLSDPLARKPTVMELQEHIIGSKTLRILQWETMCRLLGVESKEIESVKRDHPNDNVGAFRDCLRIWHKRPSGVTWGRLFEAVEAAGERELVSEVKRKLGGAYMPKGTEPLMTPVEETEIKTRHIIEDRNKPEIKLKDFLKKWMRRIKSDAETQACVQDLFQEQVISEGVSTDIKNAKMRRDANGLLYQHLRNQATVETMLKLYEVWDTWHSEGNDRQKKLSGEMRADMDKYQIKN